MIRHSITEGNKARRYIGTTDEVLSPEGVALVKDVFYPQAQELYVSPLRRCIETARLIYPAQKMHIIDDLRECDFGEFENKNYEELSGNPAYQAWLDSHAQLPFPGGESREEFHFRTVTAFRRIVDTCIAQKIPSAAVVSHGGTIMSILEELAYPHKEFYEWSLKNATGYILEVDTLRWEQMQQQVNVLGRFPGGLL